MSLSGFSDGSDNGGRLFLPVEDIGGEDSLRNSICLVYVMSVSFLFRIFSEFGRVLLL